jgi:hypothetical protein
MHYIKLRVLAIGVSVSVLGVFVGLGLSASSVGAHEIIIGGGNEEYTCECQASAPCGAYCYAWNTTPESLCRCECTEVAAGQWSCECHTLWPYVQAGPYTCSH